MSASSFSPNDRNPADLPPSMYILSYNNAAARFASPKADNLVICLSRYVADNVRFSLLRYANHNVTILVLVNNHDSVS
jgi:hypothetical protein